MIKHQYPHNHAYRRFGANCQPADPHDAAITIARLHGDCAKMRAVIEDIAAQVRAMDERQPTRAMPGAAMMAIRRILQEWKS